MNFGLVIDVGKQMETEHTHSHKKTQTYQHTHAHTTFYALCHLANAHKIVLLTNAYTTLGYNSSWVSM